MLVNTSTRLFVSKDRIIIQYKNLVYKKSPPSSITTREPVFVCIASPRTSYINF